MIAPHLLEMLDVSTPPRAPTLVPVGPVRAEVYAPGIVEVWPPPPREEPPRRAAGRALRKHRPGFIEGLRAPARRLLEVVKANPGCTIHDIERKLARQGTPRTSEAVSRVLQRLEASGLITHHELTSRRDIERAGGRYLWTAL